MILLPPDVQETETAKSRRIHRETERRGRSFRVTIPLYDKTYEGDHPSEVWENHSGLLQRNEYVVGPAILQLDADQPVGPGRVSPGAPIVLVDVQTLLPGIGSAGGLEWIIRWEGDWQGAVDLQGHQPKRSIRWAYKIAICILQPELEGYGASDIIGTKLITSTAIVDTVNQGGQESFELINDLILSRSRGSVACIIRNGTGNRFDSNSRCVNIKTRRRVGCYPGKLIGCIYQ